MRRGLLKGLCILGLTLLPISFSSSERTDQICQDFTIPDTIVLNDSTILSFNNLNFNTQFDGNNLEHLIYLTSKNVVDGTTYRNVKSFFGYYNGMPYIYATFNNKSNQGFLDSVCVQGINGFNANDFNCNSQNISAFLFANGFVGGTICSPALGNSYAYAPFTYCFRNSTSNYCFKIQYDPNSVNQWNTLSGSLNIGNNASIGTINNINWGPSIFTPNNDTYNEYACPTIQQLLNTYGDEYNEGLCYSSSLIYSGGTIQTVTPKSIFQLYPTRTNLNQDVQTYNSYCNNANTTQTCQTMFEGKTEEYTLIAKIPQNVQPIKLYQYCNLKLNYDPSQTTCTITGAINANTGITMNDIINEIGESDMTIIKPGRPPETTITGNIAGSGSVYDYLNIGNEEYERRDVIGNGKKIVKTMKELYAKLGGIFRGRNGQNGIIPPYITGILLLIVLFKLFKK